MSSDSRIEAPIDSDLESLLAAERPLPPGPRAARDRVLLRVQASVAVAVGLGATKVASAAPASSAPAVATAAGAKSVLAVVGGKGLVAALVLATAATSVGVGVSVMRRRASEPAAVAPHRSVAAAASVPAPPAAPPPAPVLPTVPAEAPASASPAVSPQVGPAVTRRRPAAPSGDLAAEGKLLEVARAALARRDPATAGDELRAHERAWPHGQLMEERESLWVQTLLVAGDRPAAEARAQRFRQRFPRSIQNQVIDAALGVAGGRP